jgi:hypothetical protein
MTMTAKDVSSLPDVQDASARVDVPLTASRFDEIWLPRIGARAMAGCVQASPSRWWQGRWVRFWMAPAVGPVIGPAYGLAPTPPLTCFVRGTALSTAVQSVLWPPCCWRCPRLPGLGSGGSPAAHPGLIATGFGTGRRGPATGPYRRRTQSRY